MAVAVICECSPFHNGHEYLFREARRLTGGGVVAVMSGSFTQRGEVAVCDKFSRAAILLRHGADLVAELPTAYAVAPAQRFAAAGVRVAKSFADVDTLAFGCETDDLSVLSAAARALDDPRVNRLIAARMREGDYYPRALHAAVAEAFGAEVGRAVAAPNNILAVEYLRALEGTGVRALPVLRRGTAHDSDAVAGGFASASRLRAMLREGLPVDGLLPEAPPRVTRPELLHRLIFARLRTMTAEELRPVAGVSEGLEHRLLDAAARAASYPELLERAKTKRYTRARLERVCCAALLGISEAMQAREVTYARILGFTDEGGRILRSCGCRIVTSVARELRADTEIAPYLRLDIRASDLAALAYDEILPANRDFSTKMLRIVEKK